MIEEFMLAANISVAEKILKHFPLCSLLRYLLKRSRSLSFCHLFYHHLSPSIILWLNVEY